MTRLGRGFALAALFALAGCFGQRSDELAAPRPHDVWTRLVADVRLFERRIGFDETKNFRTFSRETANFPFCGHVSRAYLPYSYEDPAIKWLNVATEEECRAWGDGADVTFGTTEAIGERETPVTAAMLVAPLNRFLYLVVHEDCHDQFDLPHGIEEPLCNVITFRAIARYGEERFDSLAERRAIQRFVREGATHSRVTVTSYERLAALYARHGGAAELAPAALRERERIFRTAEKQLSWPKGTMNNVWIANAMTYSRHHALIERVHEALGADLERTVAFFKRVDRAKPPHADILARYHLATQESVEFVRAYEAAVVETIERELALVIPARSGNPGAL